MSVNTDPATEQEPIEQQDAPAAEPTSMADDPNIKAFMEKFGSLDDESSEAPVEDEPFDADEEDSGDDEGDAADQDDGEDESGDLSSQLAALAEMNGLEADAFSEFGSVEDAQLAMALLDQSYVNAGREQYGYQTELPGQSQATQPQQQQPQPQQQPQQTPPQPEASELPSLDGIDLSKLEDDPELKGVLSAFKDGMKASQTMVGKLQQQIDAMNNARAYETQQQAMENFHRAVDRLGAERYGSGERLTPVQQQNRIRLGQELDYLLTGMQARGQKPASIENAIARADLSAFRDQVLKEERTKVRESIRGRKRKQLGAPQNRGKTPHNEFDMNKPLQQQPFLHEKIREYTEGA